MSEYIKIQGTVIVTEDRVSIDFHGDLANYYIWHIKKSTWNTIQLSSPRHGAHVSVILPTVHERYIKGKDLRKILGRWNRKKVDVWFSPSEIRSGGHTKGFINYWCPVKCEEVSRMKEILHIKESAEYRGEHITFGSNKSYITK